MPISTELQEVFDFIEFKAKPYMPSLADEAYAKLERVITHLKQKDPSNGNL
jgi:hypothetical protein